MAKEYQLSITFDGENPTTLLEFWNHYEITNTQSVNVNTRQRKMTLQNSLLF